MELPIHVDRASSRSLQAQIAGQLAAMMLDGRLPAGTRLPSTRALARDLGVSRNVMLAAYDELFAEGYIEGRRGSGTFVVRDLPVQPPRPGPAATTARRWLAKAPPPDAGPTTDGAALIDFRLGRPSIEPLPERLWRGLWRELAAEPPSGAYGPPEGYPELREAVARYLARSRGLVCDPDSIVITSGSLQALNLIAQATLRPGDVAAFEEPGYPASRAALQLHGACIAPVPVDDDGMDVAALERLAEPPLLVYVTPSHQYPTGARMPVARRLALLDWARRNDSLIIEDDYDSELRYDAAPLPALASLEQAAPDGAPTRHVAYIGTFSKTLTPVLRIGYVVAPPELHARLVTLKRLTDFQTAWPLQRMLTAFINNDRLMRHVRRTRRRYAEKRALLGQIFAPLGDVAALRGLDAGLHAYLEFSGSLDSRAVRAAARERGVLVSTIDEYFHGVPDRDGILLGYGSLTLDQIEHGARLLVEIINARC